VKARSQFLIFCLLLSLYPASVQAKPPDMFDLLESAESGRDPDEQACTTVVRSALGDKFLKSYLAGNTAEAERLWAQMLKQLSKQKSIETLPKNFAARYSLDIPEGTTVNSPYSRTRFYGFCLTATEKVVGKDHRFYMDCLEEVARLHDGMHRYKEGLPLRSQEYQLAVKFFGAESERAMWAHIAVAYDQTQLKEYAQAEPILKNCIEICERHGYKLPLRRALRTYFTLLLATNRKEDADKLLAHYHLRRRQ
jgi:hypothetical protein